jgi:ubiquinone/menaquinone biosynthesis C-methylase UbiE
MRLRTALGSGRRTRQSFSEMRLSFDRRAIEDEMMDDLSQPESEFAAAYRELSVVNRWLGGIRAIEKFLPRGANLLMLDVAAGGCDVSEALLDRMSCHIVALDLNGRGLKLAKRAWPLIGDALDLPFPDLTFDVAMASLFFHHLSNEDCVRVLAQMWRIARRRVIINDLHRHAIAYFSIRGLTTLFSRSRMVRHDAGVSVQRSFRPAELLGIAERAGVPARVYRSFPYRLVLVADKP